jgi:FkbM family methyltransferase
MTTIRSLIKTTIRKLRKPQQQGDTIGPYTIRLPLGSHTLEYKRAFKLYDTALGDIARIVRTKYPDLRAIDIGAHVGDTAALIRKHGQIPVLCIEGDPLVFPILMENARILGPGISIERSFVGPDGQAIEPGTIDDLGHNASLVPAAKDGGAIKLRGLRSILNDHPEFFRAKLLKTDIEGYDFDVLRQSIDVIADSRPVIFLEYDVHFRPNEPAAGLETIKALADIGYSDFIYYDNFGNFLVHAKAAQQSVLIDLHNYLASNQAFGVAVHYFDVCAFHQEDAELAVAVRSSSPTRVEYSF